jgi:hypothetical protein
MTNEEYEWRQKYNLYLKSAAWHNTRRILFWQRGKRCEICGWGSRHLFVHHLTYERLGHERMEDLQIVCQNCHEKADSLRATAQSNIREGKRIDAAFQTWCDKRGVNEPDEYEFEKFYDWLERKNE